MRTIFLLVTIYHLSSADSVCTHTDFTGFDKLGNGFYNNAAYYDSGNPYSDANDCAAACLASSTCWGIVLSSSCFLYTQDPITDGIAWTSLNALTSYQRCTEAGGDTDDSSHATNPYTFIGKGYCKTSDTPAHLPQNRPHHCFWVDAQKATYESCTQLCMQISDCIGIEVINGDRCVAYVEYQGTTASAELTQQCSNLGGNLWVTSETIEYTGGITHSSGTYLSHTGDCYSFERPGSGYRYYRLDVSKTQIDDQYWCLEELSFYDMDGNRITTDPAHGSAETQYSSTYNAGMAFNELTGGDGPGWENFYCSTYGKSEGWLQYDFQSATAISKYAIERLNYWGNHWSPVDWKFEASSDGVSWLTLDEQSGITEWTDGEVKEFSIVSRRRMKAESSLERLLKRFV